MSRSSTCEGSITFFFGADEHGEFLRSRFRTAFAHAPLASPDEALHMKDETDAMSNRQIAALDLLCNSVEAMDSIREALRSYEINEKVVTEICST